MPVEHPPKNPDDIIDWRLARREVKLAGMESRRSNQGSLTPGPGHRQ